MLKHLLNHTASEHLLILENYYTSSFVSVRVSLMLRPAMQWVVDTRLLLDGEGAAQSVCDFVAGTHVIEAVGKADGEVER